jgi:hypothetical protein
MTIALSTIPGIGPSTAKGLMENGFKSANEIAQATIAQLIGVPGFSTARASKTIKAANELLSASADALADAVQSTTQPAPRQQQTAKRPVPKSPSGTTVDNDTKETEIKKMTEKEQKELEKAKAKKAAAKKLKKAKKAKKAAAKKLKKAKKAKKAKKLKKAKKAKKAKSGAKKTKK